MPRLKQSRIYNQGTGKADGAQEGNGPQLWSGSRAAGTKGALEWSSSFAQGISCSFLFSCISPLWVQSFKVSCFKEYRRRKESVSVQRERQSDVEKSSNRSQGSIDMNLMGRCGF